MTTSHVASKRAAGWAFPIPISNLASPLTSIHDRRVPPYTWYCTGVESTVFGVLERFRANINAPNLYACNVFVTFFHLHLLYELHILNAL